MQHNHMAKQPKEELVVFCKFIELNILNNLEIKKLIKRHSELLLIFQQNLV